MASRIGHALDQPKPQFLRIGRLGRWHVLVSLSKVDMSTKSEQLQFSKRYSAIGRSSIPPEKLIRALLLQALYSIRSERLLMEELDYNLLFRWFVRPACWLYRQSTCAQASRGNLRVDEDRRRISQDPIPRRRSCGLGLHPGDDRVQPGADSQSVA